MDLAGHSQLGEFALARYKAWRDDRKPTDAKWEKNYNAFHRILQEWRDGDAKKSWKSRAVLGYAKQKIVSGVSLVLDTMLQGGEIPFMMKLSPYSRHQQADPERAKRDVDSMTRLHRQQLRDCHADRAFAMNVLSAATYGETFAVRRVISVERPGFQPVQIPGITDTSTLSPDLIQWEPYTQTTLAPSWEDESNWNIFRDMEVNDPRKGIGYFRRRFITATELRSKLGKPFFIDANIRTMLEQQKTGGNPAIPVPDPEDGADNATKPPGLREIKNTTRSIRYLEGFLEVPRAYAENFQRYVEYIATGGNAQSSMNFRTTDTELAGDTVECMVVLANELVVRFARVDPQERNLYRAVWEHSIDNPNGIGVADNVEPEQNAMSGALRHIENTSKLASSLILAMRERAFENPEDFNKGIQEGFLKLIIHEDFDGSAADAIHQVTIKDAGKAVIDLIKMLEGFGDNDSMIPKLSQGIANPRQETAFADAQRAEKAGKYIAGVIRNFDEGLIEPIMTDFYRFNMEDPAITEGKGDYIIIPTGFSSFQDRVQRITKLQQWLVLILSDPRMSDEYSIPRLGEAIGKALDMDPDEFRKTEEEKAIELQTAQNSEEAAMAREAGVAEIAKTQAEAERAAAAAEASRRKSDTDDVKVEADSAAKLSKAETDAARVEIEAEQVERAEEVQTQVVV